MLSEDLGIKLENVELSELGRAKKITVDKDSTTIVEGGGKTSDIQGRVANIKKQIDETTSDYDREKLQERLAKLAGGVAIIKVGAATEAAMKEKKDRVDDALHATRAAVEEGIVAGGGVAFIRCQKALDNVDVCGDEKVGVTIVAKCLEAPLRQLVENAGLEAALIVENVKNGKGAYGFNVRTGTYGDLVKEGVLDPAKVARFALQNAASIAGLLLITECMVTEIPEKKDAPMPNPGMGGMDM
jgi:chaperonin GroEL